MVYLSKLNYRTEINMNRYCPNCHKPRLSELPIFCNDQCEDEYKEWIKNRGELEVLEYEKKALRNGGVTDEVR